MIEPADTIVAAPDDGTSNSSDSEVDNVREDPVIKILRGFNGVSKETIGTIRYVCLVWRLQLQLQ